MAIYGEQTNSIPRRSGQSCEICGAIPERKTHRHVDCGRTIDIVSHATNRIKIAKLYADRVGRPELANKYLCAECANKLIFNILNK